MKHCRWLKRRSNYERGKFTRIRNLALNMARVNLAQHSYESDDPRSSSPLKQLRKPSVQGTLGFDRQIERPPFHKPYLVT